MVGRDGVVGGSAALDGKVALNRGIVQIEGAASILDVAILRKVAEQSHNFRTTLIRLGAERHRFVLTNHHIVLDGWSMPILLGEIFAGYHGHRLPAATPYRRYLTWLAGRDLDTARAAWGELFAGFDFPRCVDDRGRQL